MIARFVAAAELLEYRHVSFIEIYPFIRAYFIFVARSISDWFDEPSVVG